MKSFHSMASVLSYQLNRVWSVPNHPESDRDIDRHGAFGESCPSVAAAAANAWKRISVERFHHHPKGGLRSSPSAGLFSPALKCIRRGQRIVLRVFHSALAVGLHKRVSAPVERGSNEVVI